MPPAAGLGGHDPGWGRVRSWPRRAVAMAPGDRTQNGAWNRASPRPTATAIAPASHRQHPWHGGSLGLGSCHPAFAESHSVRAARAMLIGTGAAVPSLAAYLFSSRSDESLRSDAVARGTTAPPRRGSRRGLELRRVVAPRRWGFGPPAAAVTMVAGGGGVGGGPWSCVLGCRLWRGSRLRGVGVGGRGGSWPGG